MELKHQLVSPRKIVARSHVERRTFSPVVVSKQRADMRDSSEAAPSFWGA